MCYYIFIIKIKRILFILSFYAFWVTAIVYAFSVKKKNLASSIHVLSQKKNYSDEFVLKRCWFGRHIYTHTQNWKLGNRKILPQSYEINRFVFF